MADVPECPLAVLLRIVRPVAGAPPVAVPIDAIRVLAAFGVIGRTLAVLARVIFGIAPILGRRAAWFGRWMPMAGDSGVVSHLLHASTVKNAMSTARCM